MSSYNEICETIADIFDFCADKIEPDDLLSYYVRDDYDFDVLKSSLEDQFEISLKSIEYDMIETIEDLYEYVKQNLDEEEYTDEDEDIN